MAKRTLSIDYASLGIEKADINKVKEVVAKEAPHIKQGFRQVESDIEKAVRFGIDKLIEWDEQKDS